MASKPFRATEKMSLGEGSTRGVSRIVFQIDDTGALSTSAVVKARVLGLADGELVAIPYTNRGTGAVVAASTAITAAGLYEADSTGVEVVLDNTYTSGTGIVYYVPVEG